MRLLCHKWLKNYLKMFIASKCRILTGQILLSLRNKYAWLHMIFCVHQVCIKQFITDSLQVLFLKQESY